MIFRLRPDTPQFLTEITRNHRRYGKVENQVAWGLQYEANILDPNKSNKFNWATYNRRRVNQLIEDNLKNMTQNHCAFCDIFPLRQSGRTIEHYRPKSMFPRESHLWTNLFYCCHSCQEKGERFDEALLKPDVQAYDFSAFFICEIDGEAIILKPNPRATIPNQDRASITIQIYGLNDFERPEDRYRVLRQFNDSISPVVDEFPYRFLFL